MSRQNRLTSAADVDEEHVPTNGSEIRRLLDEQGDAEYARGLHPLWHIAPQDRPDLEGDELQDWLAENAPALTLEACRRNPPKRPAGRTLVIPGDGLRTREES